MLRFADALHLVNGGIVVEAELDTGAAARRMRKDIAEVFGHQPEVVLLKGSGIRRGTRYIVRVTREGESLARQTGLIDQRNRPVRGLPPVVVNGSGCDAVAAWRGAFLAHGSLTEPGRSSSLEVTCPGPEAALALVGSARRLGISAKAREVRGVDRVVIRDGDAIGQLLTRLGRPRVPAGLGGAPDAPRGRARPPTGWPTSTTPTCAARPAPPSPPGPASTGRWRSSARRSPTTCARPAGCGWSTSRPRSRSSASSASRC